MRWTSSASSGEAIRTRTNKTEPRRCADKTVGIVHFDGLDRCAALRKLVDRRVSRARNCVCGHLTIASRAGLDVVPRLLRQLRGFVRLMQLNTRRDHGYLLRVLAEHERIVDAVEARDEPTALSALRAHLHTSEYILT